MISLFSLIHTLSLVVELYIYKLFWELVTFSPMFNVISCKLDFQQTNLVQVVNVTA